jgi:hypothetical protein
MIPITRETRPTLRLRARAALARDVAIVLLVAALTAASVIEVYATVHARPERSRVVAVDA